MHALGGMVGQQQQAVPGGGVVGSWRLGSDPHDGVPTTTTSASTTAPQPTFRRHTAGTTNPRDTGPTRADNPAWPGFCRMNIALLFDESSSITSGDWTTMKSAAGQFIDALKDTPSMLALFNFSSNAPADSSVSRALAPVQTADQPLPEFSSCPSLRKKDSVNIPLPVLPASLFLLTSIFRVTDATSGAVLGQEEVIILSSTSSHSFPSTALHIFSSSLRRYPPRK